MRQAGTTLHLRIVNERGRIPVIKDLIGLLKPHVHVPERRHHRPHPVLDVRRKVAFGPHLRRVRFERRLRVQHEWQRFVVHLDQTQGLLRNVPVDGSDGRHRITHETHGVVEEVPTMPGDVLDSIVVLAATRDGPSAPDNRRPLMRDDRLDTGVGLGSRHVDPTDPRVWMRAPQHPSVNGAGQHHVA